MREEKFDYEGLFHGWGVDYEEFENGPGMFTAGIVERPDGKMSLEYAGNLRFIEPTKKE